MTINASFFLRVAALVIFILAALFGFGVGDVKLDVEIGLVATGLACWVGSSLVP